MLNVNSFLFKYVFHTFICSKLNTFICGKVFLTAKGVYIYMPVTRDLCEHSRGVLYHQET